MKTIKKVIIWIVALVLVAGIGYGAYYLTHYYFYRNYKTYLSSYEIEEGTAFSALSDSAPAVDGYSLAAESDELKLYISETNTDIAIYDKRSGEITYSNPLDIDEDSVANDVNKNIMKSQIVIYYLDSNNNPVTKGYNTYEYGTSLEQFDIERIENGVRVNYNLGDFSSSTGIVPTYLLESRFEELCSQMDETNRKEFEKRYQESSEYDGVVELISTGASVIRKLTAALETVGYTEADYQQDMTDTGVEGAMPVSFNVSIEYRLDGDSLIVNVPTSMLTETGGAQAYRIDLLNFFGAGSSTEDGYMVVPNGSGSLINFNNGKTNVANYMQYVYGMDVLASSTVTQTEYTEDAMLPVFGIVKEDSAILAVIENGDALAFITAGVSGSITSYNNVYSAYVIRNYEVLELDGGSMTVVQPKFYDVNIQVRYSFLESDYSYSGLANYYRNYLIDKGELTLIAENSDDVPFYMDVIGGVKETAYFLGTQYLTVYPMTTYEQANEMLDVLAEGDVTNVVLNYKGWFNGGYYHNVANRINLVDKLGTKKELEELASRLEEQGGKLYGDVAFQEVTSISKRYLYSTETSRYYGNGYVALQGRINPVTLRATSGWGYEEVQYYLLSPKFLDRYVQSFAGKITNYDITGIGLRDLADALQADNKRTESIDRQQALEIVLAQFEVLEATEMDILEESANAYAWKYADDLTNVPMTDNDFFIIDTEIPFYQIVVHGCINYAGDAINISDDYSVRQTILDCVETGSYPHFIFTYEDATEMKYTGMNWLYSSTFENWSEDAVEIYTSVNKALRYVNDATIVSHEVVQSGVTKVVYSNGVTIYVNRNNENLTVNGVLVPANDYAVKGVE